MGVLVISKSFIVREALEAFFKNKFESYKFNSLKNLDEVEYVDLSKVEFMFIDIESDIIENLNNIKKVFENIKIVVFDRSSNASVLKKVIKSSIDGYLVDILDKDDLVYVVKKVISGKKYYDSDLLENIISDSNYDKTDKITHTLTSREKDVLQLVSQGLTNKEIGNRLYITEHTIKKHITNILSKLDMRNRKDLIIYTKNGIDTNLIYG